MFGRKKKTDLKASGDPGGTHHADKLGDETSM
jgi:hypothetical protein